MYANGRNITMQREASMKESTFIFPAQNNNGPIYVCMYIDILMTYYWKLYTRKVLLLCNSIYILHSILLANAVQCTYTIKLSLKENIKALNIFKIFCLVFIRLSEFKSI